MEKSKPKYCHNKSSLKCKLNLIEVDYIDTNIPKWKQTCNKATNANVDPLHQLKYIPNNNKKKGNNNGKAKQKKKRDPSARDNNTTSLIVSIYFGYITH